MTKDSCFPAAGGVTPRFCSKAGGNQHHDNFFIRGMSCTKPLDAAYCHGHLKADAEWHRMHYLSDKGNLSFQKQADPLYAHNLNGVRKPQNDNALLGQSGRNEDAWTTTCDPSPPHLPTEKHDDLLLVPVLASPPLRLPRSGPLLVNSNHSEKESLAQPKKLLPEDHGIEMKTFPRENNHVAPRILLNTDSTKDPEKALTKPRPTSQGDNQKPAGLVHLAIEETLMAAMLQSYPSDQIGPDATSKKCDESIKMSKEIML